MSQHSQRSQTNAQSSVPNLDELIEDLHFREPFPGYPTQADIVTEDATAPTPWLKDEARKQEMESLREEILRIERPRRPVSQRNKTRRNRRR